MSKNKVCDENCFNCIYPDCIKDRLKKLVKLKGCKTPRPKQTEEEKKAKHRERERLLRIKNKKELELARIRNQERWNVIQAKRKLKNYKLCFSK